MRAAPGVRSMFVASVMLGAVALLSGQAPQSTGMWADAGLGGAVPRGGAAVALADGRTLILGGVGADEAPSSAVLLYDPATREVLSAGALLFARTGHTATALSDGRIVVSGGVIGGLVTGDVEVFDVAAGTATLAAVLPEPRRGHAAARLAGDAVLLVGGSGVDGAVLQTAVVVDVSSGAVTALTGRLSVARVDASATTLIDGRVLVAGGSDGTVDLATAEIYDPFAQTFSVLATSMSVPRRGHAAVLLPHNASVLVAGGTSNGVVQSGADLFLPAEFPDPFSYGVGQFAPTGAMAVARTAGVTTSTGIEGYAIADGGGAASAEVYRFATIRTDKDDYAPGELALITGTGWQPGETVRLTFQEDPAVHDDYVLDVVADPEGNLRWDQWAPEGHDLGVRFYLMASDGRSKAQTTFTDALKVTVKRGTPSSGTFTVVSGSTTAVTFEIINTNNGGDQNSPVNINYTLTVTGATATGIPLTGSATIPGNTTILRTWDIVAPTGPASATVTLSATVSPCPSCTGGSDSYSINVSAPASDSTPPVITPTITGTLGNDGWYTSNVDLVWTVSDAQSAISSSTGCGPSSVTIDTPSTTVTCSATSLGGTASASVTIKRDASAPNAPTASATPAPNSSGWNNTNVAVSFASAGDNGPSGVLSCTTSTTLTAETGVGGTVVSGTCTDNAGNVSGATDVTVKIDKTSPAPPATSHLPAPNAAGWNNTDVTVSFTPSTDALSGIASCTAPTTLTAETLVGGTVVSGTCTDLAGNVSGATDVTVKIDKTAPDAPAASHLPAPNATGWNNADVTVSFTPSTDALSGIAACTAPTTLTTDTASTVVSGTCTDNAGNTSASIEVTVKLDKSAPNAPTGSRTPPANAAGWNNTDVTVSFVSAGDVGPSGVASCTTPTTLTAETAGTNVSGTCTDTAGNVSGTTDVMVKIDKSAPNPPTASRAPAANAAGWNNTAVTVTFAAAGDHGPSGVASCTVLPPFTADTGGTLASGTCTDAAGNSSGATSLTVKVDTVPPTVAVTGVANGQIYTLGAVPAAACSTTDPLSGVDTAATVAVTDGVPPGVGTFTATCSGAIDKAANVSLPVSVTYQVRFAPAGTSCLGAPAHQVLQPINIDGSSVFKQKSTVPVKFRVCDANGVSVGTNVVASFNLVQVTGVTAAVVNEEVQSTTPDTAFRFDPTAQQWIFNTNTKPLAATLAYRYLITLTDGTTIDYQFGLK